MRSCATRSSGRPRPRSSRRSAPVGSRLRSPPQPPSHAMPLVTLIGYRGTGKSTVAADLARLLSCSWRDADVVLEERLGRSIAAVVRERGEAFFRDEESAVLEGLLGFPGVVATGATRRGAAASARNANATGTSRSTVMPSTPARRAPCEPRRASWAWWAWWLRTTACSPVGAPAADAARAGTGRVARVAGRAVGRVMSREVSRWLRRRSGTPFQKSEFVWSSSSTWHLPSPRPGAVSAVQTVLVYPGRHMIATV